MCATIILLYCLIFKNLNSKLHFGDKPTWSWFWKLVGSILRFYILYSSEILLCAFFLIPLSGFGIRVILAS